MDMNAVKKEISAKTGIPVSLLTGETAEEAIAQAKALLAFKKESPKTAKEQFAEIVRDQLGLHTYEDDVLANLESIPKQYPDTHDAGSGYDTDARSAKEKFADEVYRQLAYDPRKDKDGWHK